MPKRPIHSHAWPDLPKSTASRVEPRLVAVKCRCTCPPPYCVHDTSIHFFLLSLLLLAEGLVRGLVHQVIDLAGLRELDLGEPTWVSAGLWGVGRGGAQMGGPCLHGSNRCAGTVTPLAARSALTASLGLLVDEGGRVAERLVDLLDGARDGGVDVRRGLDRLDAADRLCMSAANREKTSWLRVECVVRTRGVGTPRPFPLSALVGFPSPTTFTRLWTRDRVLDSLHAGHKPSAP